jgi:RimJ/RimL family protein N-acetyltransferase
LDGGDALLGVFVDGAVAGSCGLHRRRGPDVLEIGYWIHVSFVRRWLATRVAALLTDAALATPGIRYVEIHHDKANVASSGVPRRLGFRLVGEGPDEAAASAELGIDCVWRIDSDQWRASSRSGVGTNTAANPLDRKSNE